MRRRRRLDDAVLVFEGIFRPSGDNDAELRRHHIQPLQVGCEALAWPRRTFAVRTLAALVDLCPDCGDAGLDLLEDKGLLLVVGTSGL